MDRDKVCGMFLGVAVGDALGMPAEGCTAQENAAKFGRLDQYHPVSGHFWLGDSPEGATTDDWQLTKAVAESMIQSRGLDRNNHRMTHQRPPTPVLRDMAEQPMFDLVPLACSRREVAHTDLQPHFVRQQLQTHFPQPRSTAVPPS